MSASRPPDEVGPARPTTVMMLGLRGYPHVQGGVERHVEELAPRLAALGCRLEVLARAPYVENDGPVRVGDVTVTPLPSPRRRSLEAIAHTAAGVAYAAWRRPDILHIHAVGPALLVPVARLLGLKVVVTHHGYDYDRAKWGGVAKAMLKLGERVGMRFASGRIAVSRSIAGAMAKRYGVPVAAIPNGVAPADAPPTTGALERFGLVPGRYVLMVARLVPEKRHLDLIAAFERAAPPGWRLALVGGADHADAHAAHVLGVAEAAPGVVATGVQTGLALAELLSHAGLFVLPSSHEGLPIALLEALSFGVPSLASAIPGNLEVGLDPDCYAPVGDVERLAALIAERCAHPATERERDALRARAAAYDWDAVAARTLELYRKTAA